MLAMPDGGSDDGKAKPAPICLTEHKRMKLSPDAIAMTGGIVSSDYHKHSMAQRDRRARDGSYFEFEPLHGGEKIVALNNARLHGVASGGGPAGRLRALVTLASAVPCWRLTRPMDSNRFAQMIDFTQRNLDEQLL